jgi:hypothetical protein
LSDQQSVRFQSLHGLTEPRRFNIHFQLYAFPISLRPFFLAANVKREHQDCRIQGYTQKISERIDRERSTQTSVLKKTDKNYLSPDKIGLYTAPNVYIRIALSDNRHWYSFLTLMLLWDLGSRPIGINIIIVYKASSRRKDCKIEPLFFIDKISLQHKLAVLGHLFYFLYRVFVRILGVNCLIFIKAKALT